MPDLSLPRGVPSELNPAATSQPLDHAGLLLGNRLIRALGPDAAATLMGAGRRATLAIGQTLWEPGERPGMACFVLSGLIAGLAADADGAGAQVEAIGAEGVIGLVEGLADTPLAFEYRALVAADAWLAPVETIRALMHASPPATTVIHRHIAHLYDQARITAACSARHGLRARLSDCLLAYQDKASLSRWPLTQETLSAVLGANRTTVTALMINLSTAGLTRTGRGWVSIVDREALDRLACGCRKMSAARPGGPAAQAV